MPAASVVTHALQAIPPKVDSRYVPQVNIAVLVDEDYLSKGQPSALSCGFLLNAAVVLCKVPPGNTLDPTAGAIPASGVIKVIKSKNPRQIWIGQTDEDSAFLDSGCPSSESLLTHPIRVFITAAKHVKQI